MAASEAEERGHKRRLSVKHTFSVRREITAFLVGPVCVHAKSLQSCPTLCDPVDSSPPGSSVHGILQARILKGVAMPFSRGSS